MKQVIVSKPGRSKPRFRISFMSQKNLRGSAKLLKSTKWNGLKGISQVKLPKLSQSFGQQWRANQEFKDQYTIKRNKTWVKLVSEARNKAVSVSSLIERRLDVSLWRMRLAATVLEAGQLISHGHVYLNDTRVNTRSIRLHPGDLVELRLTPKHKQQVLDRLTQTSFYTAAQVKGKWATCEENLKLSVPAYVEVSYPTLSGVFVRIPHHLEIYNAATVDLASALFTHRV